MKKKDKEFFRKYLTERLEELLNQADNTVSGMTETKENFPDPTDRAALKQTAILCSESVTARPN